jgi:uncharacterized radical SAM superfamily Fe-S cluster-containing enzyme
MKEMRLRQLEETESICPICHKCIPAAVVTDENAVFLEKNCKVHGPFRGSVWTDYGRIMRWGRKTTQWQM